MRPSSHRKLTRFFVINPIKDRRLEERFESRENVVIRIEDTAQISPGIGYDVGRRGLRIDTKLEIPIGTDIQIAFPNAVDNARCFGRVVWSRPLKRGREGNESGVAILAWHGIVEGPETWKKHIGSKPKSDRRLKPR